MADTAAPDCLPVLDIGRLDSGPAERDAFLADLRAAARGLGFFHLSGHGIDPALIEDPRDLARHVFILPEAEKLSVAMVNSPHFRGYTHSQLDPDDQLKTGVTPGYVRLSIGLEHPDDIVADLAQALDAARAATPRPAAGLRAA